jgi:hypothetical protein
LFGYSSTTAVEVVEVVVLGCDTTEVVDEVVDEVVEVVVVG